MKEDVFFANKEVISRETVQMVVGLVEAGIEREGLLADTTIEEVVVLGVQVKIQEVQTGEEVTEEEKQMEVDHRIVKVMEDTEGQEYEDKIETTDEEDQEVEAVISVTRIIQRKEDVADLRKKDQNLEINSILSPSAPGADFLLALESESSSSFRERGTSSLSLSAGESTELVTTGC